MFKQITDRLTIKLVEDYPYSCCTRLRILTAFEIHCKQSFRDEQSIRAIYDSITRLVDAGIILWTKEMGYRTVENV